MEDDWENAITAVKQNYNINITLKEEQKEICHLQKKKDVFGLLPTGFGKSMTLILFPLILDQVIVLLTLFLYKFKFSKWCEKKGAG